MVDFESLGALWSPGAPDPDLIRFVLNSMFRTMHKVLKFLMFCFWFEAELQLKFNQS